MKIPSLVTPLMDEQKNLIGTVVEKMKSGQSQFVLCNPCGTGKTLVCQSIVKKDVGNDQTPRILVIAPDSAISESWVPDAKLHFKPEISHTVVKTTSSSTFVFGDNQAQVIMLTYKTLSAAYKSAVENRTMVLQKEVQRLRVLYPDNTNMNRMSCESRDTYEEGRSYLLQVHAYLMRHKKVPTMKEDLPFPDLVKMEKDHAYRPTLFENIYMTNFRWMIADEAHEARNNKGVKFHALYDIRRENVIVVSATICCNSAEDYISVLKIVGIHPNQGWTALKKNKQACATFMNESSKNVIVVSDKRIRERIEANYQPTTILLRSEFKHSEEVEAYDAERSQWTGDGNENPETMLKTIMALRQRCDYAITTDPKKGLPVTLKNGDRHRVVSTKMEMVVSYLKSQVIAKQQKAVVFVWFKNAIHVLKAMIPTLFRVDRETGTVVEGMTNTGQRTVSRRVRVEVITGDISSEQRKGILSSFKNHKGPAILLTTPGTNSVGSNLQAANHCILLENWWNPVVMEQALRRTMRPGQQNSLRWVRAMISQTVEDSIKLVADFKEGLNECMIAGGITEKMLQTITSRKAIQRAENTTSERIRTNMLLPIVKQDTKAILQMMSNCKPSSSAAASSSSSSPDFLNPTHDNVDAIIQDKFDYVIHDTKDLDSIPPTVPISLAHVPHAREAAKIDSSYFIKTALSDERKKQFVADRKAADNERRLMMAKNNKRPAEPDRFGSGIRKRRPGREVKSISLAQINNHTTPSPSRSPQSSIKSSIRRLASISSHSSLCPDQ